MKYEVTYQCGHQGIVELFGPGKDRDRKLEWMKTIDCPQCSAAKRREEVKKQGLILEIELNMDINHRDEPILLSFTGDTYPYKDQIKEAGFFWNEYQECGKVTQVLFGGKPMGRRWSRSLSGDNTEKINELIENAKAMGAKIVDKITPQFKDRTDPALKIYLDICERLNKNKQ